MGFLDEVASARVDPDHIRRVVDLVEAQREDADSMPAPFAVLREFHGELSATDMSAIIFRLEALAEAIKERRTGKWVVEVLHQEYVFVPDAILVAAALAPLNLPDRGRPSFDMPRFLEIALEHAEIEGGDS
jgi:hypothetical protein